ncbi:cytochrome P460 family protein [Gymnodinialimonas sp. 2305UL16-5]|uniref:cytochrome P460 family protein n=1 Tax=Gymnodinialimonas mytili TaxID=3126503 RepID=UPI0030A42676
MNHRLLASAAAVAALVATSAAAQDCTFDAEIPDFTQEQIDALYECISDDLAAGYAQGDNAWATEYRSWGAAATGPAAPGFHSNRFLNTFVNEVGYEAYIQYEEDDESFEMPVGSVIAKESYSLREGAPRPGPLFFMERAATADYPDTDGWIYSAVQPNGNPMNISQSFCHDCHGGYAFSDSLGYPAFEVRLSQ